MAFNFDALASDINQETYSTHNKPRDYLSNEPGSHIVRIMDWVYKPTTNSGKQMYILAIDIMSSTLYEEGTELKQTLVVSGIPTYIIERVEKNIQDIAFLTLDTPITSQSLRENIQSEEGHRSALVGKVIKIIAERRTSPKTGSAWTEYFYAKPKAGEEIATTPAMTSEEVTQQLDNTFGASPSTTSTTPTTPVTTEEIPDFDV